MEQFVKNFENFLNEGKVEATAIIPTEHDKKITKAMKDTIKKAAEYSKQLKELSDEFKKKTDPIKSELGKLDKEVIAFLKEMNATQVKVDKIIAKLDVSKGKISESYKDLFEVALSKHNDNTKKVILEYRAANKRYNPDKIEAKYEISEGVKEVMSAISDWLKTFWDKMKHAILSYKESAQVLEDLANLAKIQES